jgi:SAM-dependent methyltransferase
VPRLVQDLSPRFEVIPWYETFKNGEYTLESLLHCVDQVDFALFVFTADDSRTMRGRQGVVTRDNVILEYGLFTAGLGRGRVSIIQEDGVELPVDVNGMTVGRFAAGDGPGRRAGLELAVRELANRWTASTVPPPHCRFVDAGLGFVDALAKSHEELDQKAEQLWYFDRNRTFAERPLNFDSKLSCVNTYTEALDKVTKRFWTTTFLSSGFWTKKTKGDVIDANTRMMARLANGGDVRRLFLIPRPMADEIAAYKEHQVIDRKLGGIGARRWTAFENLKQNIGHLLDAGCRVRVVYDATELFRQLPDDMKFDPADSELAIYDDWRVDVFDGGASGHISGVTCYTPATRNYPAFFTRAEHYFDELWLRGAEIGEFINELELAHESADARIDYQSQWLAFYEFALEPEDATLKTVEIKRVEEVLRAKGRWSSIGRALDIGTCTARYPIFLAQALAPDGVVIGIDDDSDCLRFARANVAVKCRNDARVQIKKCDFAATQLTNVDGRFDLITCMLGTLSHFGRGRGRPPIAPSGDLLQRTLERLAGLLTPDGLLILGTWSEHACDTREMLGIYKESDRQRLAEWTPTAAELTTRLRAARLEVIEEAQPEVRLDLHVCRPAA